MSSHLVPLSAVASPTAEDMAIDTGDFATEGSIDNTCSMGMWVLPTEDSFDVPLSGV